jgi:hypothetical protein
VIGTNLFGRPLAAVRTDRSSTDVRPRAADATVGRTVDEGADRGGGTDTPTATAGGSADFDGWFSNVGNFESVADGTGNDRVTVAVGAQGNGGVSAFDPAAVRVPTGTAVVWE